MSKAFTRESDDSGEEAALSRASTLPSGARNRMTVDGAERLQKELAVLADQKAQLEETGEGEISRDELRRVTSRMQALSQRLADAEVIAISESRGDEVRFGMFVTIRDAGGVEDEYRIVGVDEVDLEAGWISWLSPLAQAIVGRKIGDVVQFQAPAGEKKLHIVAVRPPS
ncbi:GreA/GreB family elongation factor [Chthoniobacter flavus Ellin428]|uniref:GreA/GreB family elongation factor n=1 Tax=Chthoniobacter flavus Ellin428 TaxID=497964 RepID=B4D5K0_9BACT|nr:GreA/GreB family elongation factor [Chthoniobacter flavus]EDY18405.1 GreA/GreB family elongation factor [Chthoniobacter flavus Ellin428]TCO90887.1 transcription elongation factor GreB [Chthoniobacter flavus]